MPGRVQEAVARDIARVSVTSPELASGALAATALAVAAQIDNPKNSATSKSMLARVLVDALDRLFTLTPEERADDGIDQLTRARQKRKARNA